MDNLTKAQRRLNMSRIRSTNTKLEIEFFNLLEENKIPFIKYPKIYGKPDCLITDQILVFVDSDFWHGWNFNRWKDRLPKEYWVNKIEGNRKRDRKKMSKLKKQGYRIVRVWQHELKDPIKVLEKIKKY